MILGEMSYGQIALAWLLIGVCLLLMLVILLQRGRGGGLAGAFGGGGGSSAFGAKTGDVFTWITVGLTALFVTLAVVANFVFEPEALASTVAAEVSPVDSPAPIPITVPLGEGQGVGKIELLTSDGKVLPVNTKIIEATGETATDQSGQPEGGATKTEKESGGDDKSKSGGEGGSTSSDEGDKDPGK